MKKILSIFGMLMLISSVVLAGGTPDPSTSSKMAIMKSGDVIKVFYKNEEASKVKVTIYDDHQNAVFTEEVKSSSGFVRPYNISNMPEGEYKVVMQDDNEVREQFVTTVKGHQKSLVGIIKASDERLAITFSTKVEASLRVTLLDANRNILFTEQYQVNGNDCKLFSLKQAEGAASVEVADNEGVIRSAKL